MRPRSRAGLFPGALRPAQARHLSTPAGSCPSFASKCEHAGHVHLEHASRPCPVQHLRRQRATGSCLQPLRCRGNDRYPCTAAQRGACQCPRFFARSAIGFAGECREVGVTFGGNWQGIFGAIWPVHRCRCLKSCAPMTEVGCTGHQPRLAGTPRWRVSAASDPVKHVLACASVSEKFARNQESMQGLVLPPTHSFACSFQRFTKAGGSSARSGRCACGTAPGKAGFHGFGPAVRHVSAVARRPAARGRSGCPGRGPHRRAAGRPGRGRAAVSRPSGRRR